MGGVRDLHTTPLRRIQCDRRRAASRLSLLSFTHQPPCRTPIDPTSLQKSSMTWSTSTANERHSSCVVSFQDHGSRVPENISSYLSPSTPSATSRTGRRRSLILPNHPLVTPATYQFFTPSRRLRTFSHVVWAEIHFDAESVYELSLVPFYNLPPSVKSLRVTAHSYPPCQQIFHFIRSLPLLENLTLSGRNPIELGLPSITHLSTPPSLTGTLELAVSEEFEPIARRLLNLQNGLYFRKLISSWGHKEGFRWTEELVAACSNTLECLDVAFRLSGTLVFQSCPRPMTYPVRR